MKKLNIFYWITTGLFSEFMLSTSIPNVLLEAESVKFLTHLGYPEYFIQFIGMAKILGSIAILIPSFVKLKEWAYAGLAFDLLGAVYSLIAIDGFDPKMSFMLLPFAFFVASYILNIKRQAN
jgi:hypothetical protein